MSRSFWVIAQDGQAYGPADAATLGQWAVEGRLTSQSTLQDATTNARLMAGQVTELAHVFARGTTAGTAYQQPQRYQQQAALQQQTGYQQQAGYQQQQTAIPMSAAYGLAQAAAPYQQPVGYQQAGYSPQTGSAYQAGYGQQPAYPHAVQYANPYATGAGQHQLSSFSTPLLVLLHFLTFGIYTTYIHFNLMHGRLPVRRPNDPSGGKAVRFMFIPFFNLYWVFFTYLRLCDRVNEERALAGLPPTAPRGFFLTCIILCFVPLLNYLSFLILFPVWVGTMQASVNELVRATRGPAA